MATLLDDQTLWALRSSEWLLASKELARRLESMPAEDQEDVLVFLVEEIPAVAPHVWKRLRTTRSVHRTVFQHVLAHTRMSMHLSQLMLVARQVLGPATFVRLVSEALDADRSPEMHKSVGYFLGWVASKDPAVRREIDRRKLSARERTSPE